MQPANASAPLAKILFELSKFQIIIENSYLYDEQFDILLTMNRILTGQKAVLFVPYIQGLNARKARQYWCKKTSSLNADPIFSAFREVTKWSHSLTYFCFLGIGPYHKNQPEMQVLQVDQIRKASSEGFHTHTLLDTIETMDTVVSARQTLHILSNLFWDRGLYLA